MTQNSFKNFINEIYGKGTKKKYVALRTHVHRIDDIWSLDFFKPKRPRT